MPIGVLEKLEEELGTETSAQRETITRLSETAGGVQFNSITIIENPAQAGIIGFLLAEGYRDKDIGGGIELSRVEHHRAFELSKRRVYVPRDYGTAAIMKGFDEDGPYDFVLAGGNVLYRSSRIAYAMCFVPDSKFLDVRNALNRPELQDNLIRWNVFTDLS